jgi:multimeric flavodoxin WrbA
VPVKRIVAFVGSPRRLQTDRVVKYLEKLLTASGEVEFECVFLKDHSLSICRGCFLCLDKGEEFCPLHDDRDLLLEKMAAADGIIFATPNYALHVTAIMKNFLDRLAFVFHRPRFFRKSFMAVVTQGVYGGGKIVKYLEEVAGFWGFSVVPGVCVTTLEPRPTAEQEAIDRAVQAAANRLASAIRGRAPASPSLFRLAIFRLTRSSYKAAPDEQSRDYRYFRDQGWLTSDYYYNVQIGPLKKALGNLVDSFAARGALKRRAALEETQRV